MIGIRGHKIVGYIKRHMVAKFSRERKKKLASVFEYKDVVYTIDSNNKHKFDIYVPASAGDKVFPIMLYVHGGKYITGDKLERSRICKKLASLGIVVFNLNYSLVPKYNLSQIEADIVLAMEEAMNIAVLHNGDYNQVFLAGDEVGAGLVTRVVSNIMHGVYAEYLADYIMGTVAIAGRYDLSRMKYRVKSTESKIVDCLIDELHNPDDYDADKYIVDEYYPQTVVVCGKQDAYLDESMAYVDLLEKHGISYTLVSQDMKHKHTQKALVDKKDSTMFNAMATAIKDMLEISSNYVERVTEVEEVDLDSEEDVVEVEEPKKTAKKSTTKKSTTKKTTAKKSTTAKKTTTAKKSTTKKAATKKTAEKKPATSKTAAKSTTAKKSTTKKATSKK